MYFKQNVMSNFLKFFTNSNSRSVKTITTFRSFSNMPEKKPIATSSYFNGIYHIKIGTGKQIVALLPGLFGSIETDYQLILPKLNSERFTWIAWDPPGYGNSRPPTRDFSGDFVRRDAHTFVNLMENLGYNKFSIVGWSMGGMTGSVIAIDFPDKVDKLVLWGSHSRADKQSVDFGNSVRTIDGWAEQLKQILLKMYGKDYLEKICNDWADANEKSLETFGCGDSAYENLYNGIPKIKAQTLIMYGDKDPMIGIEHAKYYHQHIRNSLFYLWPGAKHNLHLRHSKKFIQIVEHFLITGQLKIE